MDYKPLDIVKLANRKGECRGYSSTMAVNGKRFFASLTVDLITDESKDVVVEVIDDKD